MLNPIVKSEIDIDLALNNNMECTSIFIEGLRSRAAACITGCNELVTCFYCSKKLQPGSQSFDEGYHVDGCPELDLDIKLKQALKNLRDAHLYITENWNQQLDCEYPYYECFADLFTKVNKWVEYHVEENA